MKLASLLAAIALMISSSAFAAKPPNIVMIMTDDVAPMDISAIHRGIGAVKTPNIDRIAKETGLWQSGKEMAEAIWNASQKGMWAFHDMLLVARVREVMAGNPHMSIGTAVQEAEKFIAMLIDQWYTNQ